MGNSEIVFYAQPPYTLQYTVSRIILQGQHICCGQLSEQCSMQLSGLVSVDETGQDVNQSHLW